MLLNIIFQDFQIATDFERLKKVKKDLLGILSSLDRYKNERRRN